MSTQRGLYLATFTVPGPRRDSTMPETWSDFWMDRASHIHTNGRKLRRAVRKALRGSMAGCTFRLYRMPYTTTRGWDVPTFRACSIEVRL